MRTANTISAAIERRSLETSEKDNGYWLGSLMTTLSYGWDPRRTDAQLQQLRRDTTLVLLNRRVRDVSAVLLDSADSGCAGIGFGDDGDSVVEHGLAVKHRGSLESEWTNESATS